MASATEAELAALYIVAHKAVYIRIILGQMGHKQPATPLQTDNSMAEAVVNGKSNPNAQKPWICVFIGSTTENAKNNSASTGTQANSTMPITGLNTTQPNIKIFDSNSSILI
jgi:hypothetical protein